MPKPKFTNANSPENQRARRKANHTAYLARDAAYRQKNREKKRAIQAAFSKRHPNYAKEWDAKNRKKVQAKERRLCAQLSPCYVRRTLKNKTNLSAKEIPDDLMLLQRLHLKLKRELSDNENNR